jgi:hypothetical protein
MKTTKWDIFDELKTEFDIGEFLIGAKEECDEDFYPIALETASEARRRIRMSEIEVETESWDTNGYDFNEFEPENSKELVYA